MKNKDIEDLYKKQNEIILTLKINEDEINKEIYFLNFPYYTNDDNIKHQTDELKELNKLNSFIFINNNKFEYKKYEKFEKKGEYIIKLLIKINNL